jgi:hypothetical protein
MRSIYAGRAFGAARQPTIDAHRRAIARHTLPPSRLVSGLVYDVNTGLIEIVDPATHA